MPDAESSTARTRRLARDLPDAPVWIDTRGMLLGGNATVTGGDTIESGFVVQVYSGALAVVSVVGRPPRAAIAQAVRQATDMTPVFAQRDNAGYVGEALASGAPAGERDPWTPERVIFHRLTSPVATPSGDGQVRLLSREDLLDHLPPGLRFEIDHARERSPVAVGLADDVPVSFCYACWITEALWDVSIDTLDGHRRGGLAQRAVRFMVARMREERREPVWAALESNAASLALARKLGFGPVDENVVFARGPWAYFTRGYK